MPDGPAKSDVKLCLYTGLVMFTVAAVLALLGADNALTTILVLFIGGLGGFIAVLAAGCWVTGFYTDDPTGGDHV